MYQLQTIPERPCRELIYQNVVATNTYLTMVTLVNYSMNDKDHIEGDILEFCWLTLKASTEIAYRTSVDSDIPMGFAIRAIDNRRFGEPKNRLSIL